MKKNQWTWLLLTCLGIMLGACGGKDRVNPSTASEETGMGRVMEGTTSTEPKTSTTPSAERETSQPISEEYVNSEGESLAAKMEEYLNPFMYQTMRNDWDEDFAKRNQYALKEGHHYLGQAHFNDFFGNPQTAYIPYGGIINLIEGMVSGSNHGVYIANGAIESEDAVSIVTELKEALQETGFSIQIGEITEQNHLAYFPFMYEEEFEGVKYKHFGIRYAKMREDGSCLFSEMIFTPQMFDEETEALLQEMQEEYQISFANIEEKAWLEVR